MNDQLITLLSLSVSGSLLALILFALKPVMKNQVSKAFYYYIWLLVLLRLVLPVSMPVNIMDNAWQSIRADIREQSTSQAEIPVAQSGGEYAATDNSGTTAAQPQSEPAQQQSDGSVGAQAPVGKELFIIWTFIKSNVLWIWFSGVVLSGMWYLVAYVGFSHRLRRSCVAPHAEDRLVFRQMRQNAPVTMACSSYVTTPMLIGFVSPVIVLPQLAYVKNGMKRELENILCHELTHLRRKDVLYKWLAVAITSIHWFNPLMLLVRREIGRACELSCDEAVIGAMSAEDKQSYGNTLLALSANGRLPAGILVTTLCEEKDQLKERLINIMEYKKKSALAIALTLLLALMLAGCGAALGTAGTNGEDMTDNDNNNQTTDMSDDNTVEDDGNTEPQEETAPPEDGTVKYENLGYTLPLPEEFGDKVTLATEDKLSSDEIFKVYQTATQEKYPDQGWLFSIVRHTPAEFEDYYPSMDMLETVHFAKDDNYYYSLEGPTDMTADVETPGVVDEYIELMEAKDAIMQDFIQANNLTPYDHYAAVYANPYTYPGNHLLATVTIPDYQTFKLILSQPVKQGDGGIWCVERYYDEYENLYFSMPDTDLTAMEYYQDQQNKADSDDPNAQLLLDAESVVTQYLQTDYWADNTTEFTLEPITE